MLAIRLCSLLLCLGMFSKFNITLAKDTLLNDQCGLTDDAVLKSIQDAKSLKDLEKIYVDILIIGEYCDQLPLFEACAKKGSVRCRELFLSLKKDREFDMQGK
jgi:hypothetical protein